MRSTGACNYPDETAIYQNEGCIAPSLYRGILLCETGWKLRQTIAPFHVGVHAKTTYETREDVDGTVEEHAHSAAEH